jgi:hypothetical protein
VRIRFLTSTPLDIRRGSGTYVGIEMLARTLGTLGHTVTFETPSRRFPVYTLERLLFNRSLRAPADFDLTVGFDMDGYRIAGAPGHVAALKGVIADEVRFERGMTRFTMLIQAERERLHANRAARVLVTSAYSGARAQELYGLCRAPVVVPELIDLAVGHLSGGFAEVHGAFRGALVSAEARGRVAAGRSSVARSHSPPGGSPGGKRAVRRRASEAGSGTETGRDRDLAG